MIRELRRLGGLVVLALMLAIVQPSSARAVNITVDIGGTPTVFDVVFFQGPVAFTDPAVNPTLTNTTTAPWWGNSSLATDFATAYFNDVGSGPFDVTGGGDVLAFAYANGGGFTSQVELDDGGNVGDFVFGAPDGFSLSNLHYAYINTASATPVPEIDGGALGQGAVILLALWLMLRRRAAGAGLRRVAVRPRG